MIEQATVKDNGNFSLKIEIPLPAKTYDVLVSASVEGKQQSVEKIKVTQKIDEESYLQKARKITAEQLDFLEKISDNEVISVKGTIAKQLKETDEIKTIILNVDDDPTKQIVVEYHGDISFEIENKGEFYGYVITKKNQRILISHVVIMT